MGLTGDGFMIDPAEMLSGEDAQQAAGDDGVIEPGEDLPNDFYIRNDDTSTSVVTPANGADYSLLLFDGQGSPVETSVTYEEFADALMAESPDVYGVVEGVIPAMVTIDNGAITSVSQVYLP